MTRIRVNRDLCLPRFLARSEQCIAQCQTQSGHRWSRSAVSTADPSREFQIPLPPLEVQQEIVAEIEGYQKVIDGARAVLDNYRPHIPIHPDWPTPSFVDAPFEIIDGDRGVNYPKKEDFSPSGYCRIPQHEECPFRRVQFFRIGVHSREEDEALRKGKLQRGDVVAHNTRDDWKHWILRRVR